MPSADSPLVRRLIAEIERDGPVGFDRFMEVALYDADDGYFASGHLRSEEAGDFLTSPEVSPLFGETLGLLVASEWDRIGDPFVFTEVGAGSGSLVRPLLDSLDPTPPVVVVERSPAARRSILERVPEAGFGDSAETPRGVVLANEVLDNMSAALVVRRPGGWRELRVGASARVLRLEEAEPRGEVVDWADAFSGPVPEGGQVEVQLEATRWVERVCRALEAGTVVLFDYGDVAEGLENRRAEGTVRTYRNHHLGPDPLADPGGTDITMDVNFSAVVAAARRGGADVELTSQRDFLAGWGLEDRIAEMRRAELDAARDGDTMERLVLRSRITGAETLLHPRGLGDFRVAICRK